MSLKFPKKKGQPVLDCPSRLTGPKVFLTRRPLSVVGKPVLAEKHLPVKPSGSIFSRKCYCNDDECLFRFRKKPAGKRKFKPCSGSVCEAPLQFESRSAWVDEFPRQSLLQRSVFKCPGSETATVSHKTASFAEPSGLSHRNPGMRIATCQHQTCLFHTGPTESDFRFISAEARRLCRVAKIPNENINSVPGGFFSILSPKRRSRKFTCPVPVLKTFADYFTATPIFFDGIGKRRALPLDFSMAEAENTVFSMQTKLSRSFSQPVFAATLELSPEKRLLEHEIHENFVLESKAVFSPDFLRKKIILSHNQPFHRSCPETRKKFNTQPNRLLPAVFNEAYGKPIVRIGKVNNQAFSAHTPGAFLPKTSMRPADSGLFSPPRRDPKFRLKLRLLRQHFPAASLSFSTILPPPALYLINITKHLISAAFSRIRVTPNYSRLFPVQSGFAKICMPADYRMKKANFMVRATKHAHYTLTKLRNIIAPRHCKRLTTTHPDFPVFANVELRRLDIPEKISPAARLNRPDIKFNHGDLPLSLLGQNPAITSISDSAMPRRIKPATPQPPPDMRIEQSPKRRKPLRQLRFKLHSINEGFVSSKLRPAKKIEKETTFFPTGALAGKTLSVFDNGGFSALKIFRQPRLKPRLRLRRFALQQILPEQITAHLNLEMKICSGADNFKMPARHFIIPALGAKSLRRFTCRISLLPHPFGFPSFAFSEPRFYSLNSKQPFAQRQPQIKSLSGTGGFILKKDPLFLPPLSMKNPRRLLYNHLNPALASKEFYLAGNLSLKGSLCRAPRIADFLHTWLGNPGSCIVPHSEEKFHQLLRFKQPKIKHLPETVEKQSYFVKDCDTSAPRMIRIKRLLLRARRFSALAAKTQITAEIMPAAKLFRPCPPGLNLGRAVGHEPQSPFNLFNCEISRLRQKPFFNDDVAESFKSQFHARFRSFRFPWRPEIRMSPMATEEPAQPVSGVSATTIALPDELRSTAFIFGDVGANTLPLPEGFLQIQSAIIRRLSHLQQSIAIERRCSIPDTASSTMSLQNPEKCLQQFINPETFFIMREKNRSRLKKNLRSYSFRNTSKTVQLRPDNEKYSEFGLKNRAARRMPLEPLHWIIMLRSFLQPESPAMKYCVDLPDTSRRHCSEMRAFNSLPRLAFNETRQVKTPELQPGLRIYSWAMLDSAVNFSYLAFPGPVKSETKAFSATYTEIPAAKKEITVEKPPTRPSKSFSQPSPEWQPVHNFTHTMLKTENTNIFDETATYKIDVKPGRAQVIIKRHPEAFKPAFIPEWIDQVLQRPVLQKR